MANTMARYIDPMVDWSFKRLFGTEVNKDILIGFLNVMFPQYSITDIHYVPTEQLGIMEDDRKAIFDVLCMTDDGRTFIVEMQRGGQRHFFERALLYTSFPLMKQARKGAAEEKATGRSWDYSLDGVFFLGVMDFNYIDDGEVEHRYRLREERTGETMTDKVEFVFVEVAKFDKGEDELETDLDRWLFMLKNLSHLLERPAALRDRIFSKIFDVAELAGMNDEERKTYIRNMTTARDTYNQIVYAEEKGLEKGLEQGRKEGMEEGEVKGEKKEKERIARKMKDLGLASDIISAATGLDEDAIRKLH